MPTWITKPLSTIGWRLNMVKSFNRREMAMKIALYLDEDAQDYDLTQALRLRGIDVVRAWDEGMHQHDDDAQLAFATLQGRVLFGFNVRDYLRIHTQWLLQGGQHAGIVTPTKV